MQKTQRRTSGLAAILDRALGRPVGTLVKDDGHAKRAEERKATGCRMCGNKAWCTARVKLKNGVVVGVEGDPNNPVNDGKLCSRGNAAVFNLYNPYRVKAPMKRTNPKKGLDEDPGWVEISWDEALNIVAERLKKIRAEDPRKFAHMWGFGGYWCVISDLAFLPAFGTPNQLRSHGVLCPVHYGVALTQGALLDKQDVEYCEYLITIGGTLGPNLGSAHSTRSLSKARERGMKLVVVDPRYSHEATMADEWIPIRPGTDLALSLAMMNVIINEIGIFDVQMMKLRTNAVYLIGEDEDYVTDPVSKKPLIWDPVDECAKVFDDPTIKDFALEGRYEVNGVKAAVAFTLVKEHVAQYTPEWQEQITTVPAADVRRIAREFVEAAHIGETIVLDGVEFPFRPVCVKSERGALGRKGGAYQHLVSKMLCMLVGSLDVPGGFLGSETGLVLNPGPDGVVQPKSEAVAVPFKYPPDIDLRQFYPNRHTTPFLVWKTILDPKKYGIDYEVDTMMIYGASPVTGNADPEKAIAGLSKVPFVVTIAYLYDESAMLSDILLPEHALLERFGVQKLGDHFVQAVDSVSLRVKGVLARQPVVEPLHNTKQADEIYIELAERVGFLYGEGGLNDNLNRFWGLKEQYKLELDRRYSTPEIIDRVLKSTFQVEKGLEYFNDAAVYYKMRSEAESYNYYYFPLGKTRHPFYFSHTLRTGRELRANLEKHNITIPGQDMEDVWKFYQAIPRWIDRPDKDVPAEYDLVVFNWGTPQFRMGCGDQVGNPLLNEVAERFDPYQIVILMNREAAEKRGLRDGDRIVIEAYWGGKTEGKLKVTELIHPDAVGIPGSHGLRSKGRNPVARRGPSYNALLDTEEGTFDPLHGGIDRNPRVKVYKAAGGA